MNVAHVEVQSFEMKMKTRIFSIYEEQKGEESVAIVLPPLTMLEKSMKHEYVLILCIAQIKLYVYLFPF
jgi:hypothetical protein